MSLKTFINPLSPIECSKWKKFAFENLTRYFTPKGSMVINNKSKVYLRISKAAKMSTFGLGIGKVPYIWEVW